MPRAEADKRCQVAASSHRWHFNPNCYLGGAPIALLSSKLAFGATNHVVWIHYQNDAVVAVLVRTADSAKRRPTDAPLDRKDNPARPLGADFTP